MRKLSSMLRTLIFTTCLAGLGTQLWAQSVIVIPDDGFYSDSVIVNISGIEAGDLVYFTSDGSDPLKSGQLWSDTYTQKETGTLRVTVISTQNDTTEIFRSYLIDEPTELAVLSITTDPANFFSDSAGIYVEGTNGITGYCRDTPKNWNQDWEREVRLTFFERDRSFGFSENAGVKIGGGCTRLYDQKSLDIYFRDEYGAKKLNYPLFPDKPFDEYDRLSLRNGGQDWYRAMIRNAVVQSFVKDRMDLGYQAFKPVAVFLNGDYWGLHMLREKQNEDFIESNYGFDEDSVDVLTTNASVSEGSADHYEAMLEYIESNDLSDPANYEWVTQQMDIEQYIDYMITEIYLSNGDWPANNIKYWRPQQPGGKWKWILYDADMTMNSHSRGTTTTNMLEKLHQVTDTNYENPTWSTFLFRNLLKNETFKNTFIQRYSVHLQHTFAPSRLKAILDSTKALVESEIPRHMERWDKSFRLGYNMDWEKHIEMINDFITDRNTIARQHLYSFFDLIRLNSLETISNPAEGGIIKVEGLRTDTTHYALVYNSIPATVYAEAKPGYTFTGWSGTGSGSEPQQQITLTENSILTANFVRNSLGNGSSLVINEINYNSSDVFDPEDWVEIYNNSGSLMDLSGWYFSDEQNDHQFFFPDGFTLEAGGYVVISRDTARFKEVFPSVSNVIGDMDFGLSGGGELLRIFDANGTLIDEVTYSDEAPWPAEADGEGATLSLTNPGLDNTQAENWAASTGNGTPGAENSDVMVHTEEEAFRDQPLSISLQQNYPNPFNPSTTISYQINSPGQVQLTIVDITGRTVAEIVNAYQAAGHYSVSWNAHSDGVASGVYLYRLEAQGQVLSKKMLLVK